MENHFIPSMRLEEDYGRHQALLWTGCFCRFDATNPTNHPHWHQVHEVCVVTAGTGSFVHAGVTFPLAAGDIFTTSPGVIHEINSFETGDLELNFFLMQTASKPLPLGPGPKDAALERFLRGHAVHAANCWHLVHFIGFMEAHAGARRGESPWLVQVWEAFVFDCLEALAPGKGQPAQPKHAEAPNTLDTAIFHIQRNLHRKVTLAELAAQCKTCGRNLQLLFRRHLGVSPLEFANEKRAVLAAGLLLQNRRVSEVAAAVGMDDSAQFSRFFKKHFGEPPKGYQLRHAPSGMRACARHLPGAGEAAGL